MEPYLLLREQAAPTVPARLATFFPEIRLAARPAFPAEPEKELVVIHRRLIRNNVYMFLLQFVIAVTIALGSQHFGKTWGTFLDWARAVGLGFATAAAFETLFGALNRLLGAS